MILIYFAAQASTSSVAGVETDLARVTFATYELCALNKANELYNERDAADVIAEASLTSCSDKRADVVKQVRRMIASQHPEHSTALVEDVTRDVAIRIDNEVKKYAVVNVLERRAR